MHPRLPRRYRVSDKMASIADEMAVRYIYSPRRTVQQPALRLTPFNEDACHSALFSGPYTPTHAETMAHACSHAERLKAPQPLRTKRIGCVRLGPSPPRYPAPAGPPRTTVKRFYSRRLARPKSTCRAGYFTSGPCMPSHIRLMI